MSGNQAARYLHGTGRLMLAVIAAVGQAEREAMLERQREGIAKAKREGRYKGRVPTARRSFEYPLREQLRPSEIAVRLGIGRASVLSRVGRAVESGGGLTQPRCTVRRR